MTEAASLTIPEALIETLRSAKTVTVLTGAGISAESGIPTFRDSQTGLWAKYDPHELATPEAFVQNPRLVLDWYRWRRSIVAQAQPNLGHKALAVMEQNVPGFNLITQNVDGLHILAGSKRVTELHGSLQRIRCSSPRCDYLAYEWPEADLPHCPKCNALLRPDIVWFGEMLPKSALETAIAASRSCDVFFSIGTSGVVEPAASLPYEALRNQSTVIEINPQPTPLSVYTQYYFSQTAGQSLPKIVSATWPGSI